MTLCAADCRRQAREALRGNWKVSVLVVFAATFLGGAVGGSSVPLELTVSTRNLVQEHLPALLPLVNILAGALGGMGLVRFVIGGAVSLGNVRHHLEQHDGRPLDFMTLFSRFDQLGAGLGVKLLTALFETLWGLAFVIPAIIVCICVGLDLLDPFVTLLLCFLYLIPNTIARYSYTMSFYILAEYPEMGVREAIRESKRLMQGNRLRLWRLRFSFTGWLLLAVLTLTLGMLFIGPYISAAQAAFYRGISPRREYSENRKEISL